MRVSPHLTEVRYLVHTNYYFWTLWGSPWWQGRQCCAKHQPWHPCTRGRPGLETPQTFFNFFGPLRAPPGRPLGPHWPMWAAPLRISVWGARGSVSLLFGHCHSTRVLRLANFARKNTRPTLAPGKNKKIFKIHYAGRWREGRGHSNTIYCVTNYATCNVNMLRAHAR